MMDTKKSFLELKLKGPSENLNAIGTKAIVFTKNVQGTPFGEVRTYEKFPVRGLPGQHGSSLTYRS
jgi:hypothetical protein